MSQVFITNHNENIYDIETEENVLEDVPFAKYQSIHHHRNNESRAMDVIKTTENIKLLATTKCNRSLRKTMGPAEEPLRPPCNFLKQNEGIKWYRKKNHVRVPRTLAPIPHISEMRPKSEKCTKNFIHININKVKTATVRRPEIKYVDTKNGDSHLLCKSGLVPSYVLSPNFGKVPKYVQKSKEMQQKIDEERQKQHQVSSTIDGVTPLSQQDRIDLLFGLKQNWLEKHQAFQKLPCQTDTMPKIMRKSRMEKELRQLENDILLIENNLQIFICE